MMTHDERVEKVVAHLHQSISSMEKAYEIVKTRQVGLVNDKKGYLRGQDYRVSLMALKKAQYQLMTTFGYKNTELTPLTLTA